MKNGAFLCKTLWDNKALQEVTGKLRLYDKRMRRLAKIRYNFICV